MNIIKPKVLAIVGIILLISIPVIIFSTINYVNSNDLPNDQEYQIISIMPFIFISLLFSGITLLIIAGLLHISKRPDLSKSKKIIICGIILATIGIIIALGSYLSLNDLKENDGATKNIGGFYFKVDNSDEISRTTSFMFIGILIVCIGIPMSLIGLVTKNNTHIVDEKIPRGTKIDSPLDTLKSRYVKGEISKEEFEQMKKDIEEK
jgi:uncharacterized membrane protein